MTHNRKRKTCSGFLHDGTPCQRRVKQRDLCRAHLYPCQAPNCDKGAVDSTNFCVEHGGGKRCEAPGCTKSARGSTNFCVGHGGGKRCEAPGCTKSAAGSTNFCIGHGGGKRCEAPGCTKSAEGSTDFCKGHGGGKRCEAPGCTKSARGSTNFCVGHGGGKRCEAPGCTKSAEGSTDFCVGHGGGKRCEAPDCTKSARGSTDFCVAHGGGKRCEAECCTALPESDRALAKYKHPETGIRICTFQARYLTIEAQFVEANTERHDALMKYFAFKKTLIIRAEHLFYHMLVKEVPELTQMVRALDQTIQSALEGKAKRFSDLRPDYMHYDPMTNMACYGEFDENDDHEDDDDRLRRIMDQVGCGYERAYIFRVRAHMNDNAAKSLFARRIRDKTYVYYVPTERGKQVVQEVAQHVRQCLTLMSSEVPPTLENNKVVFE